MNKASLLLKHASSAEEYKLLLRELRDFIDHILMNGGAPGGTLPSL